MARKQWTEEGRTLEGKMKPQNHKGRKSGLQRVFKIALSSWQGLSSSYLNPSWFR